MNYQNKQVQNKQVLYPKLISRIFASTIDLFIISFICTPIIQVLLGYIFIFIFKDFFVQNQISLFDKEAIAEAVKTPEFINFITLGNITQLIGILTLLNIMFMGSFFVIFWKYKGATPGKILLRMKIADADTLDKPSMAQLIKRFLGYLTAPFGIWSILFTLRGQALHDKIANTVVIKT